MERSLVALGNPLVGPGNIGHQALGQRPRLERLEALLELLLVARAKDDGVAELAVEDGVVLCPAEGGGVGRDAVLLGGLADGVGGGLDAVGAVCLAVEFADKVLICQSCSYPAGRGGGEDGQRTSLSQRLEPVLLPALWEKMPAAAGLQVGQSVMPVLCVVRVLTCRQRT